VAISQFRPIVLPSTQNLPTGETTRLRSRETRVVCGGQCGVHRLNDDWGVDIPSLRYRKAQQGVECVYISVWSIGLIYRDRCKR
jgi:hypothetical protein